MNEMQVEWFDKVYADNAQLWLAVDAMLLLMVKSGMPTQANKVKQFSLDDPETIAVYVMDLAAAGIELDDIKADGHEVRRMLRFFPSSAELVTALVACKQRRKPSGVIADPVYVYQDDAVRMCAKSVALARGWAWWERQSDCEAANGLQQPPKMLPPRDPSAAKIAKAKAIPRALGAEPMTREKQAKIERELQDFGRLSLSERRQHVANLQVSATG